MVGRKIRRDSRIGRSKSSPHRVHIRMCHASPVRQTRTHAQTSTQSCRNCSRKRHSLCHGLVHAWPPRPVSGLEGLDLSMSQAQKNRIDRWQAGSGTPSSVATHQPRPACHPRIACGAVHRSLMWHRAIDPHASVRCGVRRSGLCAGAARSMDRVLPCGAAVPTARHARCLRERLDGLPMAQPMAQRGPQRREGG